MTIRAHFDGKVLVPTEPVNLPKDQLLEVDIRQSASAHSLSSAAGILQAMEDEPHIPSEDVDEMLKMIKNGQSPSHRSGIFDDLAD